MEFDESGKHYLIFFPTKEISVVLIQLRQLHTLLANYNKPKVHNKGKKFFQDVTFSGFTKLRVVILNQKS